MFGLDAMWVALEATTEEPSFEPAAGQRMELQCYGLHYGLLDQELFLAKIDLIAAESVQANLQALVAETLGLMEVCQMFESATLELFLSVTRHTTAYVSHNLR